MALNDYTLKIISIRPAINGCKRYKSSQQSYNIKSFEVVKDIIICNHCDLNNGLRTQLFRNIQEILI